MANDPYDQPLPNEAMVKQALETISRNNGYGSFQELFSNILYGVNYQGRGHLVPTNTDQHGLTFFTRPMLNLNPDNIRSSRLFLPLATPNPITYPRAIRAILDPRAAFGKFNSPLVDSNYAFIPLLTNTLISCAGWPDITPDVYTSKAGVKKEEYSWIDGVGTIYNTWPMTCNFRNIKGDPITLLFYMWVMYACMVYEGAFEPYADMVVENEIDYMTRCYRLVLDPTRQFVQKFAACGAAFPHVVPIGSAFNFTEDQPFVDDNKQISIQFQAIGAMYNDPILLKEFNDTVSLFNPFMMDGKREKYYKKLSMAERLLFPNRGYPRIDTNTNEFQIWIPMEMYNAAINNAWFSSDSGVPGSNSTGTDLQSKINQFLGNLPK